MLRWCWHSVWMLISGRIVQGCDAAIFTAPCWAVIFTSAPADKQGFIMGIVMLFFGVGLAVGPKLSEYLIEMGNWRWIY
jgi:MFS family permease